jgi:predicted transcriptional regulator
MKTKLHPLMVEATEELIKRYRSFVPEEFEETTEYFHVIRKTCNNLICLLCIASDKITEDLESDCKTTCIHYLIEGISCLDQKEYKKMTKAKGKELYELTQQRAAFLESLLEKAKTESNETNKTSN